MNSIFSKSLRKFLNWEYTLKVVTRKWKTLRPWNQYYWRVLKKSSWESKLRFLKTCPFGILNFKHYHQKSWKVFTLSVIIFYSIYGIYNGWYHLIWWISTLLTFKVKFQIFLLLSFLKEIIHLYIISLSYCNISLSIKCKVHLYFYIEKMFAHRTILMELFLLF